MEELETKLLKNTAIKIGLSALALAAGIFYITSDYPYGQEAVKLKKEIMATQHQIKNVSIATNPIEYTVMQEQLTKALTRYSDITYSNRSGSLEQAVDALKKELQSPMIQSDPYEKARINERIADTYKKMWDNSENPINLFTKMHSSIIGSIGALDECLKIYTSNKFPQDNKRIQHKRKEAQEKYERIFRQTTNL